MAHAVDPEVLREYRENGAVCLRNVFSADWVDKVRKGIEKNKAHPSRYSESLVGEGGPGAYFNDYCNWRSIPEFQDFVYNSPAAHIAAQLMDSRTAIFYHEHVLTKDPGTYKTTPWHHDQSYYPVDGDKVCSIWMPVDPVPMETCVQFVRGSQGWGWFYPRKFATTLNYSLTGGDTGSKTFRDVPDIDGDRNKYDILTWDVQPGDCIVFHMKTLHGAPANPSLSLRRRVVSTRWVGDDAVLAERPWEVSPPITGGLTYGDKMACDTFPLIWKRD
ncbi:probable phytanoyl-CoA dioxygenase isoform X1 [Branchiostoma floridae]|uniref:Probable phytanoyl-CoA dioxygenase isoform X1 n=1 Tax=Branchiostoma floridae TaxID=7739 RepID=A0A9J7LFM3_BRAFL|nr:probable phytanoyl-CoA dioxygenase isoform X1 [Branchiostoma floridae]